MFKPIYWVYLVLLMLFILFVEITNPHKEFSNSKFWKDATLDDVSEIPNEALKMGNESGSVLMWAAIGSTNPAILKALVERGAEVNEADSKYKGTALTGAAAYTQNPEIINTLIALGADIHKTVNGEETPLMIAAQYNQHPNILTALLNNGANINQKNVYGATALDLAKESENAIAIKELREAK